MGPRAHPGRRHARRHRRGGVGRRGHPGLRRAGAHHRAGRRRPSTTTSRPTSGPGRSAPCCSRPTRCSPSSPCPRVVARRPRHRPRRRAHRRRAGRLPLPRRPVPRADRRVHRDPRPDPDRGRRLAQGARRARHADRGRRPRRRRRRRCPTGPPEIRVEGVSYRYPGGAVRAAATSTPSSAPARRSPSSAPPARASRRWPSCSSAWPTPPTGRITVHGIDLPTRCAFASLRSQLVLVPQEGFLFDGDDPRERALRQPAGRPRPTCAWPSASSASTTGSTRCPTASPPRSASGASRCRSASASSSSLARAYVANPTCLLLDEATSAVDPGTETRIARALESLSRGRTSITIAHRLSTAERADRVLVLDDGRLVEQGTHDELARRRRRLRRPPRQLDRRDRRPWRRRPPT